VNIATRLIALLHRAPVRKTVSPEAPQLLKIVKSSKAFNYALYGLIGLIFILVAQWALSSGPAQTPMDTTISSQSGK
jgi:multisubunit Na+/H+ antiporter MnhB subunit